MDETPSVWRCLLAPRASLRWLDTRDQSLAAVPLGAWASLLGIALVGSLAFGASLCAVLPRLRPAGTAAWLTLSAGAGWCAFTPALALVTRRNPIVCAHACLVTTAYGETVLVTGAVVNLLLALTGARRRLSPVRLNVAWVGLSNLVMGTALVLQLRAVGVPPAKVLALWLAVLDGVGGACFWAVRGLLGEGSSVQGVR